MTKVNAVKAVPVSDAKAKLSELVDDVRRTSREVVIKKHDKEVVVIVEIDRFKRLQNLENRMRQAELRRALQGKKFRLEDVLSEIGKV